MSARNPRTPRKLYPISGENWNVVKLRLDRYGYTKQGVYFGVGEPVWDVWIWDGTFFEKHPEYRLYGPRRSGNILALDTSIRAKNKAAAIQEIEDKYDLKLVREKKPRPMAGAVARAKQAEDFVTKSIAKIDATDSAGGWRNAKRQADDVVSAYMIAEDLYREAGNDKRADILARKREKYASTFPPAYERYAQEAGEPLDSSSRDKILPRRTPKKSRAWGGRTKARRMALHSRSADLLPNRSRSERALMAGRPRRRARRRTSRRDWFGHPRLHAKAAKKGWRRRRAGRKSYSKKSSYGRKRYSAKRRTTSRRRYGKKRSSASRAFSPRYKAARSRNRTAARAFANRRRAKRHAHRDWPGQPRRHKWASELGWSRKKRRGGRKKSYRRAHRY